MKLLTAVICCLLLTGFADMERLSSAMTVYERNSRPVFDKLEKELEQYREEVERVGEQIDAGVPASSVLTVNVVKSYIQHGRMAIDHAEELLKHYQHFQDSIDHDSLCYQSDGVTQIQSMIDESFAQLDKLSTMGPITTDQDAVFAMLALGISVGKSQTISAAINMTLLCGMGDAMGAAFGLSREQMEAMANNTDDEQTNDSQYTDSKEEKISEEDIEDEDYSEPFTAYSGETSSLSELLPIYDSDIKALSNIQFPAAFKVDIAADSIEFPSVEKNTEYRIVGEYQFRYSRYHLSIPVTVKPHIKISQLKFDDANLAACVKVTADYNQYQFTEELTDLTCVYDDGSHFSVNDPTGAIKQPIRSLAGIEFLDGLTSLNLSYNAIVDYSQLHSLPLENLTIEGQSMRNLSWLPQGNKLGLLLTNTSIDDVSQMSNVTTGMFNLSEAIIKDCSPFHQLEYRDDILIIYGDLESHMDSLAPQQISDFTAKLSNENSLMIFAPLLCKAG